MDAPAGRSGDSSIGELFGRVTDDGKAFLRAEAGLYKAIAARRVGRARNGAIALGAAFLLVNAALGAFLVGLALQLGQLIGPALGGLVVLLVAAGIGYALVRFGVGKLSALGGDPEERAALQAGEKSA